MIAETRIYRKEKTRLKELKFFVVTDTHFFKNSLGAYGADYETYMDTQQKCFAETEAINRAVFDDLAGRSDADIVLIAGDLTFNGEKESHAAFCEMLHDFEKKSGKKVYVVTAGHDVNAAPYGFNDSGRVTVEGTTFGELYDFYKDFGYDGAIAFNRAHLSYVTELSEDVRLLVICNDVEGEKHIAYPDDFLSWIAEQAQKAQADGKMMIAMEHYPVLAGQPLLSLIGDARQAQSRKLIDTLADNGVHLIFTGHMHNQSVNVAHSAKGNVLYDVCTGCTIGCPAFMRLVTVKDEHTVEIESIPTPDFDWDKNGMTGKEYLKVQFDRMIRTFVDSMEEDPERFLGKVHMKNTPAMQKLFHALGKRLRRMRVGTVARLLCVRAEPQVKDVKFTDFAIDLVRVVFEGNQPFVEGTPEGDTLLRIFRRLSPFFKKMKDAQGEPVDFYEMMKHTVGNYGLDDYNTTLTF